MSPRRIAFARCAFLLGAAAACYVPAAAQVPGEAQGQASPPPRAQRERQATAAAILARACRGRPGSELTQAQIGEAMLIETGIAPLEYVANLPMPPSSVGTTLRSAQEAALVARMREIRTSRRPSNLASGIANVEQALSGSPRAVTVEGSPDGPIQLFGEAPPRWRIVCKPATPPPSITDNPPPPSRLAVRRTPEELWLMGPEARKAGALHFGVERSRSVGDDGTRTTNTDVAVDGTVGIRLTSGDSEVGHAYLFSTYNLQRARRRPRLPLSEGERESDGDTNALAVGVDAILQPYVGDHEVLDINLQGSVIFDFANDASRLRFRAIATPRADYDLGICFLGSFSDSPLRGRCEFAAEAQVAQVLRRGRTELGSHDTFVAIGVRAGIEFFLPTVGNDSPDTGFLASLRYRYLPVLQGEPDDIERWEARLAHRFWIRGNLGIDIGFTYTNGTNELSFEEEDVLTFGAGLIF